LDKETLKKNTEDLVWAVDRGDAEEVKRLIPISDPTAFYSQAIRDAA